MAIGFDEIKEQILIVLYDYMLTSDEEAFWYSRQSIRDALSPEISGAFLTRAIEALVADKSLEAGIGDPEGEPTNLPVYALTERGISVVEFTLSKKGWKLSDYHPAPSIDRIISRANEPDLHASIVKELGFLTRGLRENNEAIAILGDDKSLLADELEVAENLSERESFRLQRLAVFIVPTLRFIADKLFGSALGEAAKRLLDLLLKTS
jgi:hypothetical protein